METEQIVLTKEKRERNSSHLWHLTVKNLKTMFRDKGELAWIFGVPLFLILLMLIMYGTENIPIDINGMRFDVIDLMAPGVVISGTIVILGQIASHFNEEREKMTFLRLATTPVKRSNIIISGMISQLAVAAVQTIFSILLLLLFGAYIHPNCNLLLIFCIPMLLAFTSLGIGVIVASFLKSSKGLFGITFIIILSLIFLGNCMNYPPMDFVIEDFIPAKYAVDAMRSVMTFGDATWEAIGGNIVVLACSGIGFPIVGILLFQRKTAIK
ncbi:MAG: ABC transporter permease [Promethearchaeota archaeon]